MADLPLFWQIVVVVLTTAGLMYLLFLGIMIYYAKEPVKHEVMWDETLEEGQAPVPAWWFWSGITAAIFALLYMAFYPSFGNYKGLFNNALLAESYVESKANIKDEYYRKTEELKRADMVTLQFDADAMKLASNLFAQNCTACHGKGGTGQASFPDLTDEEWFWGNTPEQITQSIANGRRAIMPAWGAVLGKEGVDNVAKYVKSIANNTYEKKYALGKEKYRQFCIACHGVNLQGNPIFGAPNLGDSVWIYGGGLESIKQSIAQGRSGVMPAHKDRLTPLQIKLLVAWLSRDN